MSFKVTNVYKNMYTYIKNFMTQLQMSSKLICQKFSLFLFLLFSTKILELASKKYCCILKTCRAISETTFASSVPRQKDKRGK